MNRAGVLACAVQAHKGLRGVLGDTAWQRLPQAVRARFGEPAVAVDYVGEFEIVRASLLGSWVAHVCRLIGTPVVPRTGRNVPAVVRVGPTSGGVAWNREYRWPRSAACLVRSTKVIDERSGWFRFTMTMRHPWFGELFYQTGRFRAAQELS